MLPSDHFVRFYNEAFKFLDEHGDLPSYYRAISRDQEAHCLKLFREKGLQGMYEYWSRIRIEENCDMDLKLLKDPDRMVLFMRKCPSLGKVVDNDAGPCPKYCLHCPGWVIPLIEKVGFTCEYNLVALDDPRCVATIYAPEANRTSRIFLAPIDDAGNVIGPEMPLKTDPKE